MSFQINHKLPVPEEIKEQFPVPAELVSLKEKRDEEIRKVYVDHAKAAIDSVE